MKIVLLFLISGLIIKDVTLINDPYFLRAISQGTCLVTGAVWMMNHLDGKVLKRYWLVIGYMASLFLTVFVATEPIYVLFQVVSLSAVMIFFIAYFESRASDTTATNETLINTTVISYLIICFLSLVAIKYFPSYAYESISREEIRFRGLYAKSGMTGSAAGILIVLTLFGVRNAWLKILPLICGSACLALTLSRTEWVGCFIAVFATSWLYYPRRRLLVTAGTSALAFVAFCMFILNVRPDLETISSVGRVLRVGSISSLNGRTRIWQDGLTAFAKKPILGHGFTAGGEAFHSGDESIRLSAIDSSDQQSPFSMERSRYIGKTTLHNGIIQSLLDAGIVGTFFYLSAMVAALRGFFVYDLSKRYPAEFACLVFLLVTNIAQNVIYSAAVFDSILFWGLVVFALSLRRLNEVEKPLSSEPAGRAWYPA
jgi:O-antigen ligase